jgi:TRAP-type C4-dicarboxylate transport system substrate-binding protein
VEFPHIKERRMHMNMRGLKVLCTLVVMVALTCSLPCQSQAQQKTIQLKYAVGFPPGNPRNISDLEWAKRLEEQTDGRVKVTIYQGTMGKPTELMDLVRDGVADVVHMASGFAGGRMPISEVVDLPFEAPNMRAGGRVLEELYSQGLLKELDPFRVLNLLSTPGGNLFLRNKKVTKLEEMAGLKIRPIPGVCTELVESWKAVPVSVPTPDLYMAFSKGEVDGMFSAVDLIASGKTYEVCKYQVNIPTFRAAFVVLMNKDTWNKLPPDIQKIVDQVNKEVRDFYYNHEEKTNREQQAILNKHLDVYSLSPSEEARWRKAAEGVTDRWIAKMESKGLPGRKAVEVMRSVMAKK